MVNDMVNAIPKLKLWPYLNICMHRKLMWSDFSLESGLNTILLLKVTDITDVPRFRGLIY